MVTGGLGLRVLGFGSGFRGLGFGGGHQVDSELFGRSNSNCRAGFWASPRTRDPKALNAKKNLEPLRPQTNRVKSTVFACLDLLAGSWQSLVVAECPDSC